MGRLSSLGKLTEILKYVILSMGPYPRAIHDADELVTLGLDNKGGQGNQERDQPYVTIYGSHHAFLGLFDGHFEALCLTVTGHRGRSMAYSAVRIHPDDGLAHLGVSGVHLSNGGYLFFLVVVRMGWGGV